MKVIIGIFQIQMILFIILLIKNLKIYNKHHNNNKKNKIIFLSLDK